MNGNLVGSPLIASLALGAGLALSAAGARESALVLIDDEGLRRTTRSVVPPEKEARRSTHGQAALAHGTHVSQRGSDVSRRALTPGPSPGGRGEEDGGIAGEFATCPNPNHDCFTTGGPGCSDEACCDLVCGMDPFCCETAWDGICVNEAASFCDLKPPVICPRGAEQEIAPQCPVDGSDSTADPNGGCNSIPAQFDSIELGQTVCGEIGTFIDGPTGGEFRDTDWYAFSLAEDTEVSWSVVSNVPVAVFILSGGCPTEVLVTGTGFFPATATACLDAGDYVAFVATQAFGGVPCGSEINGYIATLSGVPCEFCGPCGNLKPDHDCLSTGSPGCTDLECCNFICEIDPFCCQTAWDNICVSEAASSCAFDVFNDQCWKAYKVELEATPFVTNGTSTDGPPLPRGCLLNDDNLIHKDVWFSYSPTFSGALNIVVAGKGSFQPKVAVYTTCDCPVTNDKLAACNDGGGSVSEVEFAVTANMCYLIRIGSGSECTFSGAGFLTLTAVCPCTCPADIAPPGGNGVVDIDDLFEVIGSWGPCTCAADIAPPGGNGVVDIDDLFEVIDAWGVCE